MAGTYEKPYTISSICFQRYALVNKLTIVQMSMKQTLFRYSYLAIEYPFCPFCFGAYKDWSRIWSGALLEQDT